MKTGKDDNPDEREKRASLSNSKRKLPKIKIHFINADGSSLDDPSVSELEVKPQKQPLNDRVLTPAEIQTLALLKKEIAIVKEKMMRPSQDPPEENL